MSPLFKKLVHTGFFGEVTKSLPIKSVKHTVIEKPVERQPIRDNQYMIISKGKVVGWENL